MFARSFLFVLALTSPAVADDFKVLEEDKRKVAVAEVRAKFKARKDKLEADIKEAREAMKFKASANQGRIRLQIAQESMTELRKNPLYGLQCLTNRSKVGDIGRLPDDEVHVEKVDAKGTRFTVTASRKVLNFEDRDRWSILGGEFVLQEKASPAARAGYRMAIAGAFYVTETEDRFNREGTRILPLVYLKRVHIDKEEMPK